MRYKFDNFTLDIDRGLLLRDEIEIATEPRAFDLLTLLISNHDRMLSKDEVIEKVWSGRIVSDAAISTVLKTARKALNDDGTTQKYIRTSRGRGFRFVGKVNSISATPIVSETLPETGSEQPQRSHRPSLAILPFRLVGYSEAYSAIADALPAELISSLARLRWVKVVSRGSTFRFRHEAPDLTEVRQALGVNYCLTGLVEIFGAVLAVSVELSDTRTQAVIWSERFSGTVDDIHQTRNDIVTHVISALELHIPLNEANRARLQTTENLDAWGIYHLGLQHMYRFNRADNDIAAQYFERATKLDSAFARAHAARSFTSFQSAFLRYAEDRVADVRDAYQFAERAMELDPVDPFANFTLGRAYWLRGEPEAGLPWIDRAIELSPNFAQGFYAHAWADVMAGRGTEALKLADTAVSLSPLDPFLYAMHSTKGLAYLQLREFDKAALWAEKGARAPGAHYLISAIAAVAFQQNSEYEKAQYWADIARERQPDASVEAFFRAFPFEEDVTRKTATEALLSLGFKEA